MTENMLNILSMGRVLKSRTFAGREGGLAPALMNEIIFRQV